MHGSKSVPKVEIEKVLKCIPGQQNQSSSIDSRWMDRSSMGSVDWTTLNLLKFETDGSGLRSVDWLTDHFARLSFHLENLLPKILKIFLSARRRMWTMVHRLIDMTSCTNRWYYPSSLNGRTKYYPSSWKCRTKLCCEFFFLDLIVSSV